MSGYDVVPRTKRAPGTLVTAAFVLCRGCHAAIDAMNGPGNALCEECWQRILDGAPEPGAAT